MHDFWQIVIATGTFFVSPAAVILIGIAAMKNKYRIDMRLKYSELISSFLESLDELRRAHQLANPYYATGFATGESRPERNPKRAYPHLDKYELIRLKIRHLSVHLGISDSNEKVAGMVDKIGEYIHNYFINVSYYAKQIDNTCDDKPYRDAKKLIDETVRYIRDSHPDLKRGTTAILPRIQSLSDELC